MSDQGQAPLRLPEAGRGSARHRGLVALGLDSSVSLSEVPSSRALPAIPDLASSWTLSVPADASVDFDFTDRTALDGPPELPPGILEIAASVSWEEGQGELRVKRAFEAGFWARLLVKAGIAQTYPVIISAPASHFVVLRAAGLGAYARFKSKADFDSFVACSVSGNSLVASGFARLEELEVFCIGASIPLPALYTRCQ